MSAILNQLKLGVGGNRSAVFNGYFLNFCAFQTFLQMKQLLRRRIFYNATLEDKAMIIWEMDSGAEGKFPEAKEEPN